MEEQVKTIYESENVEVLYFNKECATIIGDTITWFDMNSLLDTVCFVKVLSKYQVSQIERAKIISQVMELVDKDKTLV